MKRTFKLLRKLQKRIVISLTSASTAALVELRKQLAEGIDYIDSSLKGQMTALLSTKNCEITANKEEGGTNR